MNRRELLKVLAGVCAGIVAASCDPNERIDGLDRLGLIYAGNVVLYPEGYIDIAIGKIRYDVWAFDSIKERKKQIRRHMRITKGDKCSGVKRALIANDGRDIWAFFSSAKKG